MKVAVVTGASRGIGRAVALRLAGEGYTVAVNYRSNEAAAREVLDLIRQGGGEGMLAPADVSDPGMAKAMIREVDKAYGQIDLLVNNAGVVRDAYLLTLAPESVTDCFKTNVNGYFYCAQAAALKMYRRKSGCIINISSVSGEMAIPGQSVYSATKGAVNAFTRVLAKELSPRGIRVNAVAPGFIATEMTDALPPEKREEYIKTIPMGRFGTPEEVAEAVAAIASGAFSYMTGQVITLDGGVSL